MAQPDSLRDVAFVVWERLLHAPYKWGGDDPMSGVDCSGFVLEGLKAAGLVGRDFDTTAEGLLSQVFVKLVRVTHTEQLRRGMLVFWGRPGKPMHHVEVIYGLYPLAREMCVLTIGASGGGSATVSADAAVQQNAYVKIRPVVSGWAAALDPFS